MRKGQPRKTKAPIMTKAPRTKRVAGAEPVLGSKFFAGQGHNKGTQYQANISGRTYCTALALCRLKAPAISRSKQAMQNPILAGLPKK